MARLQAHRPAMRGYQHGIRSLAVEPGLGGRIACGMCVSEGGGEGEDGALPTPGQENGNPR